MIDEKYTELVTAYLDGTLDEQQKTRLDEYLEKGLINRDELNRMVQLQHQMQEVTVPEPSSLMQSGFYDQLESFKRETTKQSVPGWMEKWNILKRQLMLPRLAMGLAVLMIGIVIGVLFNTNLRYKKQLNNLSQEVTSMRSMMVVNMLNQPSSFERLKAVNISSTIDHTDDKVIDALLKTLNNDPNVNVRLATIDVLVQHGSNPKARAGLVRSITHQTSPLVQAALADAMVALQDTSSVKELRELLKRKDLNQTVKNKIHTSITKLL
ncbi:MAG TPA: HEAT repeat domain-containing protein [Balneolales bacterium]|nr:HEAT repeat domain-containing protein [Balneolales bacterium]